MTNVSGLVGLEQRIADGSGNNQQDPTLGTVGSQLINLAPRKYVDGVGQPHEYANARHISNTVVAQDGAVPNADGVSDLFTFFGQFIDHDIDITHAGSGGAMSTTVPMGYGTFAEGSLLHLSRSNTMDGTGTTGPREYANEMTSFVDGSNIYGSSATVAGILRGSDGNGGKSAYLMTGANGGLPTLAEVAGANPGADLSGILDNPMGSDSVFVAGDIRANENVALTSMHTVWVNEHNYQVNKLRGDHPNLSEDELFDAARVIVEAEYQNVVFNEYLPQLLGASNIPEYQGYDSNVDPSIAIEFSTAAFRLGHSQLSSTLQRLNADGSESDAGHLNLFGAFFNPAELQNEEDLSTLIRGLSDGQGQQVDTMIVDDVRNMLFGEGGPGMDLATLNIMRGRDHGIATLNEMREALGLDVYTNYSQLTSDPVLADALASVYASIDDVELWVGGLAEDKVSGSQLGAVFHTIVLDQFMRLRDGDRFYHEERLQDFPELLAEIADVSLSDILLRNTNIDYLQDDVFVAHNRIGGTNGHDHIVGSDGHDLILGFGGHDLLYGGRGDDDLYGGAGHDEINGGRGDDVIDGESGKDLIIGWRGDDELRGGDGDDDIYGGHGNDWIDGGADDDRISAGNGHDVAYGGEGNDLVKGGWGNDHLEGGDGRDKIIGNQGNDWIDGGDGNDKIYAGRGNDQVFGGAGHDEIYLEHGQNIASGGEGRDVIVGGKGNDVIDGGADNDTLYGRKGSNVITGGSGDDEMWAGRDDDLFVFDVGSGSDEIFRFNVREDVLDVSAYGISSFEELSDALMDRRGTTTLELGDSGDEVVLVRVDADDLDASNFIFSDGMAIV